jgi:lipopolysaccharide biosynthesis glycosyltransferase
MKKIIPIFYACDKSFLKYTAVSIRSLMENASPDFDYHIHILHNDIGEAERTSVCKMAKEGFSIQFDDVSAYLHTIQDKLPLRDYYSKTTYYRFFIADMFLQYEKAIYIDGDTIVRGDISELYRTNIKDAYVGACHEQVMLQTDVFGTYAECVTGVDRRCFFNAGLLLINCTLFREKKLLSRFFSLLAEYNFVVTQDEDYLNVLCRDHVFFLDSRWNTELYGDIPHPIEESKILHYIMTSKPWRYPDAPEGDKFWHYAERTEFFDIIKRELSEYTDEERLRDTLCGENLVALAKKEIAREDNYLKALNAKRDQGRLAILDKIAEYERAGRFDEDVENDPPSKELLPEKADYYRHSLIAKIKTRLAFSIAHSFVYRLIKNNKLIIKEIRGLEHINSLTSGAIITCNHFHAFDSFAIQLAYEASSQSKRTLFRIIREGNYTSFSGFYGFLMRHCNTLPLSSNSRTLRKFLEATNTHIKNGNFVLVYPEQSMWYNYRKPKPLKRGAFIFAAKNHVPVLPCFITMRDSEFTDDDGFPVQEYTINICPPIYPDKEKRYQENVDMLMKKNFATWKEVYEQEYGIPLEYESDNEVLCEGEDRKNAI